MILLSPNLRVYAVHDGLGGRSQTAAGRSDRLAIRPGNEIPRLRFRRKRGAMRHWSLGNGSGRYQRCDSRSRGFTGAGIQRLFPAKSHCKYLALRCFLFTLPHNETFSPVANRRIDIPERARVVTISGETRCAEFLERR